MRFVVVYIAEAHASDEWPVGALISTTKQPCSLRHRVQLAARVHNELVLSPADANGAPADITVLVDDLSNNFMDTMAAWPIRMYVVDPRSGILLYKAQPEKLHNGVYGYPLEVFEAWLEDNVGTRNLLAH